jgi:hypothetical protein
MISVGAFMEEFLCAFVDGEIHLFKRLFVTLVACVDPLIWQHNCESQFPNIDFITKQILGILKSQIKIEHTFNLVPMC